VTAVVVGCSTEIVDESAAAAAVTCGAGCGITIV